MDDAMPRRLKLPSVEVEHVDPPSPFNPEGIKGAGEGGTIGALATIGGAVEDALSPLGLMLSGLSLYSETLVYVPACGYAEHR
jgi:carbon-monoxide dehydrogenase large subunit